MIGYFFSRPPAGGLLFNVAALTGASFVLTVFQVGAVGFFAGRVREIYQIGAGFGLLETGIALLSTTRTTCFVFAFGRSARCAINFLKIVRY